MTHTSSAPPKLWLIGLIAASFVVQADDYMVLGIMEPLSTDLNVSEAAAGQLVTVYSLIYAIGAPLLALVASGRDKRVVLAAALVAFAGANFAVVLIDTYAMLMVVRILAAVAAAVILPAALAIAAHHAPRQTQGRAMSMVMLGLTGAVVIGVPAGALLADVVGWRWAFGMCGVIALIAAAHVSLALPETRSEGGGDQLSNVRTLVQPQVLTLFAVTVVAVAGNLTFQTYLAPLLMETTGIDQSGFAVLLVAIGLAGLAGTYASGAVSDKTTPLASLLIALGIFAVSTAAVAGLWVIKPVSAIVALPLLLMWSAAAWAVPPAVQSLLIRRVGPARAAQALAFNSSTVYLGAAVGSAAGGVLISIGTGMTAVAASLAGVLAILITLSGAGLKGRAR